MKHVKLTVVESWEQETRVYDLSCKLNAKIALHDLLVFTIP